MQENVRPKNRTTYIIIYELFIETVVKNFLKRFLLINRGKKYMERKQHPSSTLVKSDLKNIQFVVQKSWTSLLHFTLFSHTV